MKTLLALLLLVPSLSWGDKIFLNCDCKKDIQYYIDGEVPLKPSYSGKEKSCDKKLVLTLNIKEKYKDSNDRFNFLLINEDNFWGAFSISEQSINLTRRGVQMIPKLSQLKKAAFYCRVAKVVKSKFNTFFT